jgi:hypothetical protein
VLQVLLLLLAVPCGLEREITFDCRGLESYEIHGRYSVDAGVGNIRAADRSFVAGFSIGPMVEQAVPAERRAGLRWMKVESIGPATVRYGYDVKQNQLQATIVGASMSHVVNVFALPPKKVQFVTILRLLAVAPCKARYD